MVGMGHSRVSVRRSLTGTTRYTRCAVQAQQRASARVRVGIDQRAVMLKQLTVRLSGCAMSALRQSHKKEIRSDRSDQVQAIGQEKRLGAREGLDTDADADSPELGHFALGVADGGEHSAHPLLERVQRLAAHNGKLHDVGRTECVRSTPQQQHSKNNHTSLAFQDRFEQAAASTSFTHTHTLGGQLTRKWRGT